MPIILTIYIDECDEKPQLCNLLLYQTRYGEATLNYCLFSKSNQRKLNLKVADMIEIITTTDLFANLKK